MTWQVLTGDCLTELAKFAPGSFDAVITDPPYGVNLETKTSDYRQSKHFDHGESLRASQLYRDDPTHVVALIQAVMPEILRLAPVAMVFCGAARMFDYPRPEGIGCVFTPNGAGQSPWGFQCSHPILFYGKDPYLVAGKGSRPNSFKTEQPNREVIDHPCPKPVQWMRWAVNRMTFPGQRVLDPFCGSGTTGVACVELGRNFLGIEISEEYAAIARRRIEQATRQGKLGL